LGTDVTGKRAVGQSRKDFSIEEVEDLNVVWPELEALLKDSHFYYLPIVGYGPPPTWVEDMKARFKPGAEALILVGRLADVPVAFANAQVRTAAGSPPQRFAYLDNVYVVAEARGQGIGQAILARVQAWAAEKETDALHLDCLAGNDIGLNFWRGQGFDVRAYAMFRRIESGPNVGAAAYAERPPS